MLFLFKDGDIVGCRRAQGRGLKYNMKLFFVILGVDVFIIDPGIEIRFPICCETV